MSDTRARFRALHQSGCFVLPNPWDIGGARRLAALGFQALASSSAAAAWTIGKQDRQITLEEALEHLRMLCRATDLPVNADFEAGFADEPEGVGRNVVLAIDAGVAGLSIEDRTGDDWIARRAGSNGVISVSWQQICLGKAAAGHNVDVHVTTQLLHIWDGPQLLKTVPRTTQGDVRKKHASIPTNQH